MFKEIFSSRVFIGALLFFVLTVGSSLLYMQHVERQEADKLVETQQLLKELTEQQTPKPTTSETPVADTSQGGHFHEDGTFHAKPHTGGTADTLESRDGPIPANHIEPLLPITDENLSVQPPSAEYLAEQKYNIELAQHFHDIQEYHEKVKALQAEREKLSQELDDIAKLRHKAPTMSDDELDAVLDRIQKWKERHADLHRRREALDAEMPMPPVKPVRQ